MAWSEPGFESHLLAYVFMYLFSFTISYNLTFFASEREYFTTLLLLYYFDGFEHSPSLVVILEVYSS